MTLEEKLAAIREASRARIPSELRDVMERGTERLRASGIMLVRAGQAAPDFTLPDDAGHPIGLKDLRARGPVVLSFYRGRW